MHMRVYIYIIYMCIYIYVYTVGVLCGLDCANYGSMIPGSRWVPGASSGPAWETKGAPGALPLRPRAAFSSCLRACVSRSEVGGGLT